MTEEARLAGQIRLYAARPESWEDDEAAVRRCRSLEEALAQGVFVYAQMVRFDEEAQSDALTGSSPFDATLDSRIQALYREWHTISLDYAADLDSLEAEGFEVGGAKEFRRCLRAVGAVLTPDAEYFTPDALAKLQDSAIDSYRAGDVVGGLSD